MRRIPGDAAPTLPRVSIIMPSYNHEAHIEESVRSVWAQTYPNVELVVVDDGSRDRSPQILRELADKSPIPMRLLLKENEGVTRTMNRAFALTTGEFIGLTASDDRLLPNHAETLAAALRAAPADVALVFADVHLIDEQGHRFGALNRKRPVPSGWVFEDVLLRDLVVYGHGVLVRAEAFRAVGGYNENSRVDDWEFFLRIAKAYRMLYVPVFVAEYRAHLSGHLNRNTDIFVADWLRLFDEMTRDHQTLAHGWRARRARGRLYLMIGQNYYTTRELSKARQWLRRSVMAFPLQYRPWMLMMRSLLGRGALDLASQMRRGSVVQSRQS